MNTRHYYLRLLRTLALAALTAAATAACSDDTDNDREPLTPPDGNGGIPVTFTANINPGSDADPAAPDTRTVLRPDGRNGFTVEWKGKDTYAYDYDWIYIWAVKGTTVIPDRGYKNYVPTTSAASSALVPRDDAHKLTLPSTGEWKFTATYGSYQVTDGVPYVLLYYLTQSAPGNTGHIAANDFSVATATQTVAAENDEMPQSINLGFKHKLSALQLRITNQTGEELTVKEIRLSAAGGQMAYRRGYDVAQGKWQTIGEYKDDYLKLTASNFPALPSGGTESQDLHMLLFPEPEHSRTNMTVTVITSRGEYSRTKPAPDGGFLAGKNYLTDITLRTDGLTADEKWVEYITNKAELIAFRDKVNNGNNYSGKTVRLAADIDLTNEAWTPIGTDASKSFQGTFDGGGHLISKLSVDNSNNYAGLFGYVKSGIVRNLRVSGKVKTATFNAGGIAGYLYESSTVENCIFDGDVSGTESVGGIAGYNDNSRITGCHTKGKVTATGSLAGGIAGTNTNNSTIDGCYSEAIVTANLFSAGGIAGSNTYNGAVTHCYATGKVSGQSFVGGIVGYQYNSTLTGCIALNPGLERTEGSYTEFGRIVGENDGGTLISCAAFDGMTIKDVNTTDFYADATGEHGTALPAAACLAKDTYTTTLGFAEPTATTPGWAFDAAAPWAYLPWNKVFEDWNIPVKEYRIAVPDYLNGGGTN